MEQLIEIVFQVATMLLLISIIAGVLIVIMDNKDDDKD